MATETTPSSSLARSRPIVLSIASVGAAYCAYLVYKSYQSAPTSTIQRSNAIHHPRRRGRQQRQQEVSQPVTSAPATTTDDILADLNFDESTSVGIWNFTREDGQVSSFDLRLDSLPTTESLQREYEMDEAEAQSVLNRIHSDFVQRFVSLHLGPNGTEVPRTVWLERWPAIQVWLEGRGIPRAQVGQALDQLRHRLEQQMHDQRATVGETESIAGTEAGTPEHFGREPLVGARRGELSLKQLLYHIAESQARQEGYLHRGFRCDHCNSNPIRGTRWKCANCPDIDLCNDCHATSLHYKNHIFYEIRIPTYAMSNFQPIQDLSYTGHPENMPQSLSQALWKPLVLKTGLDKSEIEGLYDQFSCLADTPRNEDALGRALDRPTFQKALMPLSSRSILKPSLVFDRLFALFDTDADGLVSFEEFVIGVSFIRSRSRNRERRQKIFNAYDIDGDGFVTRKDFLRMFRSFFSMQKEVTLDLMTHYETENAVRDATQLLVSSQTLSSAFTEDRIPRGESRPLMKKRDEYGDVRNQPDQNVMNENSEDTVDREELVANAWESHAQFPFDHRTGEALSVRDFLYLAPRDRDGRPANHIARDQRVHFAYNGRPVENARREAWRERWRRRKFYTDEEEGVGESGSIPFSYSDPSPERAPSEITIGGYEIPVHEQDLGREIIYQVVENGLNELIDPLFKPKEDLALEVDAARPDLGRWKAEIESFREKRRKQLQQADRAAQDPLLAMAAAAEDASKINGNGTKPTHSSNGHPPELAEGQPNSHPLAGDIGSRMADAVASIESQVFERSLEQQFDQTGYGLRNDGPSPITEETTLPESVELDTTVTIPNPSSENRHSSQMLVHQPRYLSDSSSILSDELPSNYDPTMPQFKPNSETDLIPDLRPSDVTVDPLIPSTSKPFSLSEIPDGAPHSRFRKKFEAEIVRQFEHMFLGWDRDENGIVRNGASRPDRQADLDGPEQPPIEARLAQLARLQEEAEEIEAREGPGKLNFDEFDSFIMSVQGNDFSFLENWLELCYF